MANTTNLVIPLVASNQAQKEVTVNTAIATIDAILNTGAIDRGSMVNRRGTNKRVVTCYHANQNSKRVMKSKSTLRVSGYQQRFKNVRNEKKDTGTQCFIPKTIRRSHKSWKKIFS